MYTCGIKNFMQSNAIYNPLISKLFCLNLTLSCVINVEKRLASLSPTKIDLASLVSYQNKPSPTENQPFTVSDLRTGQCSI